ncbi:hypothetical protein DFJ58DRAFT_774211 [Suillus subalutaceus]|uniref:uncharacterized protein n=1 Tax=Suillus subalutaceus TaxID=48586 RepID=UPI001B85FC96|nr:uncharacterized protein DFJ58DRAFT_774211 [Suillus subalutaceus]KAG1863629.1 hypothetical protein DFJ58DRAFT_774211 [Suillus subalutaceus]
MATSRTYPPPVNLKERIAALQQRNVSPSQQQMSQFASKNLPSSGTGCLRDKIAKFEEKGGIPVPRGSFGMGAPQLAENAPAKKRGELYGNRVQNMGRPGGSPSSRSGSPLPPADDLPLPRKRCVSTGGTLLKGTPPRFATGEPIPPLPSTPSPILPFARRNSLAVDFGPTQRVVSFGEVSQHVDQDLESPSPSPSPSPSLSTSPSLGVRDPAGIIAPSQTLEPVTSSDDVLPQDMNALSQAGQEPAVLGLGLQADSNPVPAMALDVVASSQSSPEVVTVVKVTSVVEPDQTIDPPSDEKPQSACHHPLSVDVSMTDAQPSEAALPDSSSTISHSLVAPNTVTEDDSVLTHPLTSTITSGSGDVNNKKRDDVATSLLASESPPTEECGTISLIIPPHPRIQVQPSPPSPDLETAKPEVKRSFTAVVHHKVTEMAAATAPTSSLSTSMTPQVARVRRTGITITAEPLLGSGYGELAILLEEAALLEMKLTEGDGSELVDAALSKTPTVDTFATDIRPVSSSTLTEHVKAPSTETASLSERSISIPSIREPNMDGDIPEEDEGDGRSLASTSTSQRSPSHKRYLSSIRRLTSRRSSNYMPGAYPRDSISTCSEDSAPVATPSDHGDGSGFGITWPVVSTKKGGAGKSSSFADKLFNRNRTKSNVSIVDTDQGSIYNSPKRSFKLSQPPALSPTKSSPGRQASELPGSRPSHWMVSRDSSSSPAPSILEKEIFDEFPSVPQTLPPGPLHLSPDLSRVAVRHSSTLPVKSRKHSQQRTSMV